MSVDESTGERILHHRLLDFGHNAVAIKVRAVLCRTYLAANNRQLGAVDWRLECVSDGRSEKQGGFDVLDDHHVP